MEPGRPNSPTVSGSFGSRRSKRVKSASIAYQQSLTVFYLAVMTPVVVTPIEETPVAVGPAASTVASMFAFGAPYRPTPSRRRWTAGHARQVLVIWKIGSAWSESSLLDARR
jgi:hypothetical protein